MSSKHAPKRSTRNSSIPCPKRTKKDLKNEGTNVANLEDAPKTPVMEGNDTLR